MTMREWKVLIEMKEEETLRVMLLSNLIIEDLKSPCKFDSFLKQFNKMRQVLMIHPLYYPEAAMLPVRFATAAMIIRHTLLIMYIIFYHAGNNDFNATEIVTQIPAAEIRLEQRIQIFDDEINEAQEVFVVVLRVENNFTVRYNRQATVCWIAESDRQ